MFGGDEMFGAGQGKAMEASFKEFLARPENRSLVEKHQRREVKQAVQLQEKAAALRFRDKVMESEYEAQVAIAPFLRSCVLRRVVQTFANDPRGDFGKWATNPRVLEMLATAQRLMDEGRLGDDEAEEFMLRALRDPASEHHAEFAAKSRQVARLPTDQLVEALNEHLTERRQGNAAYRSGQYAEALAHYERARAVVELVRGLSRADQAEVDVNRVAVHCNIAAVHLAAKDYGAAVGACGAALALQPGCRKALARRARANVGRHEYAAAAADVEALRALDAFDPEVRELEALLRRTVAADREADRAAFGRMFDRPPAAAAERRRGGAAAPTGLTTG